MNVIFVPPVVNPNLGGAAAAAARRRRIAQCEQDVVGYVHDTATEQQRVDYAQCAALLYPQPDRGNGVIFVLAICTLLAIAFMVLRGRP